MTDQVFQPAGSGLVGAGVGVKAGNVAVTGTGVDVITTVVVADGVFCGVGSRAAGVVACIVEQAVKSMVSNEQKKILFFMRNYLQSIGMTAAILSARRASAAGVRWMALLVN